MLGFQHRGSKGRFALLPSPCSWSSRAAAAAQTDVTTSRISGTVNDGEGAPARGHGRGCQQRDRPHPDDGHRRGRLLPHPQPAVPASTRSRRPSRASPRVDPRGSPPAPRLDPDGQLHPGPRHGGGDHHRHHPEVPLVEVTNTQIGTTIQSEQIKDIPTQRPRLQEPGAAHPARPVSTPSAATCRSAASAASTPTSRRRRRLQQRLLRRHGRRRRRALAAVDLPGVDQGVLGDHQRRLGRVRPLGRRLRQRHHQERHQQPPRLGLLLQPAAEPDLRLRQRPRAGRPGEAAVRLLARRPDHQGQAVLLPVLRQPEAGRHGADRRGACSTRGSSPATPGSSRRPSTCQTSDGDVTFGRLDFQASDAHRFLVRGNFTDYDGENGTSTSPAAHRDLQRPRGA